MKLGLLLTGALAIALTMWPLTSPRCPTALIRAWWNISTLGTLSGTTQQLRFSLPGRLYAPLRPSGLDEPWSMTRTGSLGTVTATVLESYAPAAWCTDIEQHVAGFSEAHPGRALSSMSIGVRQSQETFLRWELVGPSSRQTTITQGHQVDSEHRSRNELLIAVNESWKTAHHPEPADRPAHGDCHSPIVPACFVTSWVPGAFSILLHVSWKIESSRPSRSISTRSSPTWILKLQPLQFFTPCGDLPTWRHWRLLPFPVFVEVMGVPAMVRWKPVKNG